MSENEFARAVGTALAVGVIGPLFWLGVGVLRVRLLASFNRLRERRRARHAQRATAADSRLLQ
jgi:hypothetical protein